MNKPINVGRFEKCAENYSDTRLNQLHCTLKYIWLGRKGGIDIHFRTGVKDKGERGC